MVAMTEKAAKYKEEHDTLRLELVTPERIKAVCEVCGVFTNSNDNEQRKEVRTFRFTLLVSKASKVLYTSDSVCDDVCCHQSPWSRRDALVTSVRGVFESHLVRSSSHLAAIARGSQLAQYQSTGVATGVVRCHCFSAAQLIAGLSATHVAPAPVLHLRCTP